MATENTWRKSRTVSCVLSTAETSFYIPFIPRPLSLCLPYPFPLPPLSSSLVSASTPSPVSFTKVMRSSKILVIWFSFSLFVYLLGCVRSQMQRVALHSLRRDLLSWRSRLPILTRRCPGALGLPILTRCCPGARWLPILTG